jgi:hypothetical protein
VCSDPPYQPKNNRVTLLTVVVNKANGTVSIAFIDQVNGITFRFKTQTLLKNVGDIAITYRETLA